MSDKPTMNDALKALLRSGSANPDLQERVAATLAPKAAAPKPVDSRTFSAALRRLTTGAPSLDEAIRRSREATPTVHYTDRSISPPRSGPAHIPEEDR